VLQSRRIFTGRPVTQAVFGVPQDCGRQDYPICDGEPPCLNHVPTPGFWSLRGRICPADAAILVRPGLASREGEMDLKVFVLALFLLMLGACDYEQPKKLDYRLPTTYPTLHDLLTPTPEKEEEEPPGEVALILILTMCADGTYVKERRNDRGACSHHGGFATWTPDDPAVTPEGSKPPHKPYKSKTESAVDRYLKQLPKGSAVFTAPTQADQYRRFDVTLRLENKELGAMLADALSKLPNEVSEGVSGVHMSDRMRAELIGGDFSPSGDETIQEQPSSVKEGTTWKWQVHSDTPGKNPLIARIETLMKVDGKDTWKAIEVAEVTIDIKINQIGWAMHNWKWIATAIVLPLIGWFAKSKFTGAGKSKDQAADPGE
jgi:hypothetical protein